MSKKAEDIKNYYKNYLVSNVKNTRNLKNEIHYNLYKQPQKELKNEIPTIEPTYANHIHQADLLTMPNDNGYTYVLTVVDCGTRKMDAEPLKNKESKTVIKALQKIYKRKIIEQPKFMEVDSGTEFQGEFSKELRRLNIHLKTADPDRHRQIALAESRNKSIGTPLMKRMTAEELITNEKSTEWVDYLKQTIEFLNKRFETKPKEVPPPTDYDKIFGEPKITKEDEKIYPTGTTVRYKLDRPIDLPTGQKLTGKFRAGDIKWSKETTKIDNIAIRPNQPIMYHLEGRNPLYTKKQLQVVSPDAKLPPASVQKKFIVEKIISSKMINNKKYYYVKWKGYSDNENTYEPRDQLIKDVPKLVEEFEKK